MADEVMYVVVTGVPILARYQFSDSIVDESRYTYENL